MAGLVLLTQNRKDFQSTLATGCQREGKMSTKFACGPTGIMLFFLALFAIVLLTLGYIAYESVMIDMLKSETITTLTTGVRG